MIIMGRRTTTQQLISLTMVMDRSITLSMSSQSTMRKVTTLRMGRVKKGLRLGKRKLQLLLTLKLTWRQVVEVNRVKKGLLIQDPLRRSSLLLLRAAMLKRRKIKSMS